MQESLNHQKQQKRVHKVECCGNAQDSCMLACSSDPACTFIGFKKGWCPALHVVQKVHPARLDAGKEVRYQNLCCIG